MKKVLLTLIMLTLALFGCKGMEKEVTISKSTIQKMTEKKFPIEKSSAFASVRLFSPKVFFQDNSIGITIQYSTVILIREIGGTVSFKCKPVYRPENTSFYMSDFELTDFTMNNISNFAGKNQLMSFISAAVNGLFRDTPLYQLNPDDYKQNIAKMLLKSVAVRGDNLVLLLSL